MNYKYIYLVFSKTGTWLSKTLNIFSETKYVHASLSFDNSFKEMYSFGRTNPNNPFSGGLVKENLSEGVYTKFSGSECLIFKVKVTEEQYLSLIEEVEKFFREKEKYKYNFLGLIGLLLNIPIKRKNYYFCSQFVSELLIKSKIYMPGKAPELIKTNDLFSIKDMEFIYEGLVNEYYKFNDLSGVS